MPSRATFGPKCLRRPLTSMVASMSAKLGKQAAAVVTRQGYLAVPGTREGQMAHQGDAEPPVERDNGRREPGRRVGLVNGWDRKAGAGGAWPCLRCSPCSR